MLRHYQQLASPVPIPSLPESSTWDSGVVYNKSKNSLQQSYEYKATMTTLNKKGEGVHWSHAINHTHLLYVA